MKQFDLICLPSGVQVMPFFDADSSTFSYVVRDSQSRACAIIDSVLGFDYASGATQYQGADAIVDYVRSQGLEVEWHLETHVHADHLSAAPYLQDKLGGQLAIGEHIVTVQNTFGKIFNEGSEFQRDGSQFDRLLREGDQLMIGKLTVSILHTPGHTPACLSYVIDEAVFVGDTLFMPDAGTARADFPGGNAGVLFDSVNKILNLPEHFHIFMCHDYQPNQRELQFVTTVAEQKERNIHINQNTQKEQFVAMREARDKTLDMPRLILPSLQVNMRGGHFPEPEDNGTIYLKVPINAFSCAEQKN